MNKRILVVEDDLDLAETLKLVLPGLGYAVTHACNGDEATKWLTSDSFDVVLTDLTMPSMSGIELIIDIRRKQPKLKVIAMSGGGLGTAGTYLRTATLLAGIAAELYFPIKSRSGSNLGTLNRYLLEPFPES